MLAGGIAAGAAGEGAQVRLRRAALSTPESSVETERESYVRTRAQMEAMTQADIDDLRWADGLVFGSPTRYGQMSTPLRQFIDEVAPLWREGALIGKVGAAFTSSGGMHSGHEMTLLNILLPFLQHGMLILGVPHSVPELVRTKKGGFPYGAGVVTGFYGHEGATADELAIAKALGARVARVAARIEPEPAPVRLY